MTIKHYKKGFSVLLLALVFLSTVPAGAIAQMYYNSPNNAVPHWNKTQVASVVQGQSLSLSVNAIDDNGDYLTYASVQLPENATFNPFNQTLTFTPSYNQLGSFPVTLSVTDNRSTPVNTTFYINVTSDASHYVYGGGSYDSYYNQAPYFTTTSSYYTASSGSTLRFTLTAIDPEGGVVRYAVSGLPSGASFNNDSRTFSWTPAYGQRGTYTIQFTASDAFVSSTPLNVTIVVDGGNNAFTAPVTTFNYTQGAAPYFTTSPSTVAVAGQLYVYSAAAFNPTGASLTYALILGPTGAFINSQTGVLTWTSPIASANQNVQFTISVTDNRSTPVQQNFTVALSGGRAPVTTVVARANTVATQTYQYPQQQTYAPAANVKTIYVSAGSMVPQNYQTYTASAAYGVATTGAATAHNPTAAFNIAMRVNEKQEMVVTWDSNTPTRGEVVFGYNSQPSTSILNYDFTTGQLPEIATQHEINVGQVQMQRTYYLRIISRSGTDTNISPELIFIPLPSAQATVPTQPTETASVMNSFADLVTSNGFLLILGLIVIGLLIYILARRDRQEMPPLDIRI